MQKVLLKVQLALGPSYSLLISCVFNKAGSQNQYKYKYSNKIQWTNHHQITFSSLLLPSNGYHFKVTMSSIAYFSTKLLILSISTPITILGGIEMQMDEPTSSQTPNSLNSCPTSFSSHPPLLSLLQPYPGFVIDNGTSAQIPVSSTSFPEYHLLSHLL